MNRFAIAMLLGLVLILTSVLAQENTPSSTNPGGSQSQAPSAAFKVCSAKNPPPCATPPRVIKGRDPDYSNEARRKNIRGTTVLYLIVGTDGLPRDIRVARSIGYGLDEEAIEAVKKWKFKPSTLDGHPVAVQVNVEVAFRSIDGTHVFFWCNS
jgi:TonB family protein